jgi:bifunctional DNA-binding transcriptional regulator/antitoxin component of YhaV-PrlF toxin-antitoxin module
LKGFTIKRKSEIKEGGVMLAKLTAKNQITIPKDVISRFSGVRYFDVEHRDETIILKPVKVFDADLEGIRKKIRKLGLSEDYISEAVRWARSK